MTGGYVSGTGCPEILQFFSATELSSSWARPPSEWWRHGRMGLPETDEPFLGPKRKQTESPDGPSSCASSYPLAPKVARSAGRSSNVISPRPLPGCRHNSSC